MQLAGIVVLTLCAVLSVWAIWSYVFRKLTPEVYRGSLSQPTKQERKAFWFMLAVLFACAAVAAWIVTTA